MIRRFGNKIINKFYNKKSLEVKRISQIYEAIKSRNAHNYMIYQAGGGLLGTLNILNKVLLEYENLHREIEEVEERLERVIDKLNNNTEIENLENIIIQQQIDFQINKPELKIRII